MKMFNVSLIAAHIAISAAAAWGEKPVEGKGLDSPAYKIVRAGETPKLDGDWDGSVWKTVVPLEVSHFYLPEVSDHRPKVQTKVVYDDDGLYVHFRVEDRYVRAIETKYHGKVWEDACVEFFVQPKPERGYFNFEINCGGTMLLSYEENPAWKGASLRKSESVPWELAKEVKIFHSLPETVEPERSEAVIWQVEYFVPFKVLEANLGDLGKVSGQTWRANFYKCAENNSHPHWASWSPIGGELDFHKPEYFAPILFVE